jgi:hypothetical protein
MTIFRSPAPVLFQHFPFFSTDPRSKWFGPRKIDD